MLRGKLTLRIENLEHLNKGVFSRRRAIDTDGSNLVTVNEFAGLLRRYQHSKKKGSTVSGKEPLPEYDIAGHARRIMAMADKMVKNEELTVTEMQTFLANTESVFLAARMCCH